MLTLGSVTGSHLMPHKTPDVIGLEKHPGFTVHHFISQYCNCSKGIFKHLISRQSLSETKEIVHLIGDDENLISKLKTAGYVVEKLNEEEAVKKYNLEALPLFVIVQDGHELHKGGYGKDQQHSTVYNDVEIINKTKKIPSRSIASFPVFGCANGKLRKSAVDFWSLKYEI